MRRDMRSHVTKYGEEFLRAPVRFFIHMSELKSRAAVPGRECKHNARVQAGAPDDIVTRTMPMRSAILHAPPGVHGM